MIEVNDVYYISDQFGPKFVRIITSGSIWTDKPDEWVFFLKTPYLINIFKSESCDRSQMKKEYFDHLIKNQSFGKEYRGAIKLPQSLLNEVKGLTEWEGDIERRRQSVYVNYPFLEEEDLICKRISLEDYRNMQLEKILS
jgi:hypothetical protein